MYGDDRAQAMDDVEFLADAGQQGWVVLTKNPDMWQVPREREAILTNGTKVFCLSDGQAARESHGFSYGRWFLTIRQRAAKPGPCFWRINPNRPHHDCP